MNLKTYKFKGLDKYIANVESKDIAIVLCLLNKIGITENDLEETEFQVPENYIQCFMTLQEIHNAILEILPIKVMPDIDIYSVGLCYCSVCAKKDKSIEEITSEVNYQYPTGIASNWQLSEDNFASGASNPCQCEDDPDRLHYLFEC